MTKNKASNVWNKSPITSTQQVAKKTLANMHEVRASLENEIRRCEMDELTMANRSKQMDVLSDQLEVFLQIQLPAASAFDLTTLRTQLQESIAQLESEVSHSMEAFVRTLDSHLMFPNPDIVPLVERQAVGSQRVVILSDNNKTPVVNGVAQEENSDIVYITDNHNPSKIKKFGLNTCQVAEVRIVRQIICI